MNLANYALPMLTHLVALVFGAGGGWFLLKQVRKDVNGLGQKFGRLQGEIETLKLQHAREQADLAILILSMCPADQRFEYAKMLRR